jgi:spore maturation protein CgeB
MRIFYASDTSPNSYFESNIWRNNLLISLVDLGHEIVEFDYNLRETFQNLNPTDPIQKRFIKKNRKKVSEELFKQIKKAQGKNPLDVFFSLFFDACISTETIDKIRSMRIKTMNFYCNASYQLDLVSEISTHYDYCLVSEKFRIKDYKQLGANPIYFQEAANPLFYKPYNEKKIFDVTFVGQAYGERPDIVKYLLENSIDINVFGIGWDQFSSENKTKVSAANVTTKIKKLFSRKLFDSIQYRFHKFFDRSFRSKAKLINSNKSKVILPATICGKILTDSEMVKMYSRSKINLGFSSCGNTHLENERILQIRLRDFEVPMSGGFYMVEYMKELEEFFDIGKEIICYKNKEDMVEKIKYFLKNDSEREKIRIAGRKRCLRDHTWQKRFKNVFKQIQVSQH